jgi:hypothetical protein
MTIEITQIATAMSGVEQASLGAVLIGLVGLIAARMIGRSESITPRPYGKVYGGAPAANTESKPDA